MTKDDFPLRPAAEELLRMKPDMYLDEMERSVGVMFHELRLHKIELEMQNQNLIEMQQVVEETRTKYARFFESSPVACFIVDTAGAIQDFNAAAMSFLSVRNKKVLLRTPFSLCVAPESKPVFLDLLYKMRKGSEKETCEVFLRRREGKPVCAVLCAQSLRRSPGEAICHIALIDITARREAEEQERTRSDNHRMDALSTMAGGVAHEVNNALAVIMGYAEMALEDAEDEKVRESMRHVLKAAIRVRETTKALISFSRQKNVSKGKIDLCEVVRTAAGKFEASMGGAARISMRLGDTLPAVLADAAKIEQLVTNLCANAAAAVRETGGDIEISVERAEAGKLPAGLKKRRYILLRVRDTGKGIDEKIIHRVFEPFFTTKASGEGLGLGLSVAYGIVKKHDGQIDIESAEGKGTTVSVYLPEN